MNQQQFNRVLACVFFLFFSMESRQCLGFTGTPLPTNTRSAQRQPSSLDMYVPSQRSNQAQPKKKVVERQMIPNPTTIGPSKQLQQRKKKQGKSQRRYNTELSNSVLAECNTLPSLPTAHGLLSPETVMRMEEQIEFEGHASEAVDRFLKQYRRQGPMSCLSMLSDPDVLPHLTKAMRDVV